MSWRYSLATSRLLSSPAKCTWRQCFTCVCRFVCLLAISCENYWLDLDENFTGDLSLDKEKLIEFWKLSASVSRSRNFLKDSSTLWDRAFFHNLAHVSGNLSGSPQKFYRTCIFGQGSSLWTSEVIEIQIPDLDWIRHGRGLHSRSTLVNH